MGQAVKAFFDEKKMDDLRLTLMPLEGEGTIDHRVDKCVYSFLVWHIINPDQKIV